MKKAQALRILREAPAFGYIANDLIVSPDGKRYGVLLFDELTQRRIPVRSVDAWNQTDHGRERLEAYRERCRVMIAMQKTSYTSRLLPN